MVFKVIASIIAAALLVAFVSPVVIKLKDGALIVVVLIGVAMMVTDLWQSMRKDS